MGVFKIIRKITVFGVKAVFILSCTIIGAIAGAIFMII